MLDSSYRAETLKGSIAALPCEVALPEGLRADFERSGVLSSVCSELRGAPRVWIRGHERKAGLGLQTSLQAIPRDETWSAVYTTTLSRNGVGFFHSQQLFPKERLQFRLPSGFSGEIEVTCCRRIGPLCYEVGARFVESLSGAEIRAAVAAYE